MAAKRYEEMIKQVKDFIELWVKFHDLYQEAITKEKITPEEEKTFLETKSLIARKYQKLLDTLGIDPTPEDKTFNVISQVLSLSSVSSISDMQMSKIESDWHESYISLNKILGSLEGRAGGTAPVKIRLEKGEKCALIKPLVKFIVVVVIVLVALFLLAKYDVFYRVTRLFR